MTIRHGLPGTYRHQGCRCTPCRAAHAAYNRETRAGVRRSVNPAPVHEHIMLLLGQGWTKAGLARHVGYHVDTIKHLASGRASWTREETALDILSVPLTACVHHDCGQPAASRGVCTEHLTALGMEAA